MAKFTICIDILGSRFKEEAQAQKNILCGFHILIDDWSFPSNDWLDFPIVVLGWWLEGYIALSETNQLIENSFMNGPYEFSILLSNSNLELDFFKRTKLGNQKVASFSGIPVDEYKAELIQAANKLLNALAVESFSGKDFDYLQFLFSKI